MMLGSLSCLRLEQIPHSFIAVGRKHSAWLHLVLMSRNRILKFTKLCKNGDVHQVLSCRHRFCYQRREWLDRSGQIQSRPGGAWFSSWHMKKCRWELLHINHIPKDTGGPSEALPPFWSSCTKEMIGMTLAGLLAPHRCAFAAVLYLGCQEEIVHCA
jgi:hypothetical protein